MQDLKIKQMQTLSTKRIKREQEQSFKTHVYVKDNIIVFGDKLDLETKCLGTLKCQKYEESI